MNFNTLQDALISKEKEIYMNNEWISKAAQKEAMAHEEDMILKRWEHPIGKGLLDGIAPERRKDLAVALENQRLLNERWHQETDSQFNRVSIPMVRRLMGAMPELVSYRRNAASVFSTNLCFKSLTLTDKFAAAMRQHSLVEEANHTAKLVEDLAVVIRKFMKDFERQRMVFLGLTLNHGFLCFYYDWE